MTCRRESVAYFVAAGVAENLSVLLLIVALTAGSVSVVAPLSSVSPIFVLVLSFFFLRGIELLNARIVAGTVLIVAGVYLLTALR
jgi:DME family drug/metabolite transporter